MSILRSDEEGDKKISGMGVELGPREGSDGGQTRDRMGPNGGSD